MLFFSSKRGLFCERGPRERECQKPFCYTQTEFSSPKAKAHVENSVLASETEAAHMAFIQLLDSEKDMVGRVPEKNQSIAVQFHLPPDTLEAFPEFVEELIGLTELVEGTNLHENNEPKAAKGIFSGLWKNKDCLYYSPKTQKYSGCPK